MFSFLFRAIGYVTLALALVLAVLDITRSITAGAPVLTSIGQSWSSISPATLLQARETVTTMLPPFVWDPVINAVLTLPSWLLFWLVAMFLLWIGQRRDNPYGRFASR